MTLEIHSAVQGCPELMQKYFIAQPTQLTALHIMDLFANLNVLQEDKKLERARGFLVEHAGHFRLIFSHSCGCLFSADTAHKIFSSL